MAKHNPFFHGNPVPPTQFVGRRRAWRRIVSRILNQGQSTAIVGEPRSGKTSLLFYLAAPETRDSLYSKHSDHLLFSYMDGQTFSGNFTQPQFWERALLPLHEKFTSDTPSPLAQAYQVCQDDDFGVFVLERLFTQVRKNELRFVLMLDEFDLLLCHPVLNSTEFFGGLRSLASRSRGALALIIASRSPLAALNERTQELSRTGSPYFNFLDELTLGPLFDEEITKLLDRAEDRFTTSDRRYITKVAGGHPYLLQVAASELWLAYEESVENSTQRWQLTGERLYDTAVLTLEDTWRVWSPVVRKTFTIIALTDVAEILQERRIHKLSLIQDLHRFGPEMRALRKQGFVIEDETRQVGWRVYPQAFLWWLVDELVRSARHESPFTSWLQEQELEDLLKQNEKEQLYHAAHEIRNMLQDGAATLIEAAAKGAGEAVRI